jgi:low affinity Fe/Cu permease
MRIASVLEITHLRSEVVNKKSSWFSDFAGKTARAAGQPVVFALVGAVIVVWLITGPFFGFSDTWQLIINTGTTIVTFLMVFLIQNTQTKIQKRCLSNWMN